MTTTTAAKLQRLFNLDEGASSRATSILAELPVHIMDDVVCIAARGASERLPEPDTSDDSAPDRAILVPYRIIRALHAAHLPRDFYALNEEEGAWLEMANQALSAGSSPLRELTILENIAAQGGFITDTSMVPSPLPNGAPPAEIHSTAGLSLNQLPEIAIAVVNRVHAREILARAAQLIENLGARPIPLGYPSTQLVPGCSAFFIEVPPANRSIAFPTANRLLPPDFNTLQIVIGDAKGMLPAEATFDAPMLGKLPRRAFH